MVGVLDVLHVELPVVGQGLGEAAHHPRRSLCSTRRSRPSTSSPRYSSMGGVSGERRREDEPGQHGGAQLARPVVRLAEGRGHAALAVAALLERDADQAARAGRRSRRGRRTGSGCRCEPLSSSAISAPRWAQRFSKAWISPCAPRTTMTGISPRKRGAVVARLREVGVEAERSSRPAPRRCGAARRGSSPRPGRPSTARAPMTRPAIRGASPGLPCAGEDSTGRGPAPHPALSQRGEGSDAPSPPGERAG